MMYELHRRGDWDTRLISFLDATILTPFSWVDHCCVRHAGGAVRAQTDVDVLHDLGAWDDAASARIALRAQGGLGRALGDRLPEIACAAAGRGDLAIARHGDGLLVALVMSDGLIAPGAHGAMTVPRSAMRRAFKVG